MFFLDPSFVRCINSKFWAWKKDETAVTVPWVLAWLQVMERSPLGRFVRFNRKLGSGSYKVVFLGFDNDTGSEGTS